MTARVVVYYQAIVKQTNLKDEVTLAIDTLSYGPCGIGRLDGKAVMVPNTAPGDQVMARIIESQDRYSMAELIRVLTPAQIRQPPPCPYVPECGGCSWQHISYAAQLKAKEQSVGDALRRIGKLADFELRPIIPSALDFHYRRRIRLQSDQDRRLGFYRSSSHRLVEIERCLIADEKLNRVLDSLRHWLVDLKTPIEYIEIVTGDQVNQLVGVVGAVSQFESSDDQRCESLLSEANQFSGLIFTGPAWRKVWGQPWITAKLFDDLSVTVDADVFTQVNPLGNRQMLAQVLTAGDFNESDHVLELYCGAGNFTLPIAQKVKEIVAVEADRRALANGKLNAQQHRLENIVWVGDSVPRAVTEMKRRRRQFSKLILDPPRAGAKGIETDLASLNAQKIIYVSCNPATLARDAAGIAKQGYHLETVQPIDLFPHTFHVESVAWLTRP